ncbi:MULTISPECIES: hypothetical protein [Paenibacillus]|nr:MULTISPECIES: hypothetical protein [Paenibacillus]
MNDRLLIPLPGWTGTGLLAYREGLSPSSSSKQGRGKQADQ